VLADLQERYPAISVVVLSASKDRDNMLRALDLGALGFIPKSARRAVMLSALQLVISGGILYPTRHPRAPGVAVSACRSNPSASVEGLALGFRPDPTSDGSARPT